MEFIGEVILGENYYGVVCLCERLGVILQGEEDGFVILSEGRISGFSALLK